MARSLGQWLDWQSSIHPRTIELGLARMHAILARLPVRRPGGPVIVVAGTNGKGSVAAYLEALLRAGGRSVGTYTSPHLIDYNERIRIDGQPIASDRLCAAFEIVETARGDSPLTFFEYGTAAALVAFSAAALDAWVLEVGLGGRLDAVNAVDGDASVVVSIGLDHMDWLGPDVESIGREKAGVFRAGRPAVLGSRQMPASVPAAAQAIGARAVTLGRDFDAQPLADGEHFQFRFRDQPALDLPLPALPGRVQCDNAATALATLAELGVLPAATQIAAALTAVRLPGRFERHVDTNGRTWILDVAHNPPAAENLAANLAASPVAGRTYALVGVLADKDAAGIATALRGAFAGYVALDLEGERARSAAELARAFGSDFGVLLGEAADVAHGMELLAAQAANGDRLVVFGSFHVVGPALEWLRLYSG